MSGHESFDHAVQEGNIWLRNIAERLHFDDRRHAYSGLRAVLHALRDRLPPDDAVHFSAQLPMIIRGLYFEGWHLAGKPNADRTLDAFCAHIADGLPPKFPMDAKTTAEGVFDVIWTELDEGEVAKVIDRLPVAIKALWPAIARRA